MSLGNATLDILRLIVVNVESGNSHAWSHLYQGLGNKAWNELMPDGLRNQQSKRNLANLRLVNRAFCAVASQLLFSHIDVSYDVTKSSVVNMTRLEALLTFSDNIYNDCIRHFRVNFDVPRNCVDRYWIGCYLRNLAFVLPIFMARAGRLETLAVRNLVGYSSRTNERPEDLFEEMGNSNKVTEAFIKALRRVPLPYLRRLSLWLPASVELQQLAGESPGQLSMNTVVRRLRHVDLGIWDNIDNAGFPWDEMKELGQAGPLPKRGYAALLLGVLDKTPNLDLESLSISTRCEHVNLAGLAGQTFLSLRTVHLAGVSLPSRALLSVTVESAGTLHTLELNRVLLTTSRWADVLPEIARLEKLCHFSTTSCGYDERGASRHWREDVYDAGFPNRDLGTSAKVDFQALGCVQRAVNERRALRGLTPVPEYQYRHLFLAPPAPESELPPRPASPAFELPDGFEEGEWETSMEI
ncbi:hypothetical protein HRG_000381 [Hirsutella rhossiliensis]|uniref:Uncharacterized protein n=1 Tax=Hirsutella rhossiliensis TaxID=111463 RepID=A0A9P8N8M4_9HYPO|nr:uncharacterized protein HRG_00381 [Hirsutella rhossiliensis]KAH0967739.1 hypothetical protein HRG_00381 [Hirsutella rhossiliensis]